MITIGHRGAAGYEPENTILSFNKALELGVDMIELDIQLCKSGEFVVIHDFNLDRTTNGSGLVVNKTLTELKKLDAGKRQEISSLEESLKTINRKTKVNIELKSKSGTQQLSNTINHFIENENWQSDDFIISSFNHEELVMFNRLMPQIKIGVLYEDIPNDFNETASALNAYSINVEFYFLTEKIVKQIHKLAYKVYAYTVNSNKDKLKMKEIGVDGIFTDFP